MKNTVRISKAEYDELREYRFKQLFSIHPIAPLAIKDKEIKKLKEGIKWRDDGIKDLEDEIDKKNEEIECLKGEVECQRETIKRMSQQLTEHELYEKKKKENAPTGVPAIDATMDRLLKLEAKYEAQENPYFF